MVLHATVFYNIVYLLHCAVTVVSFYLRIMLSNTTTTPGRAKQVLSPSRKQNNFQIQVTRRGFLRSIDISPVVSRLHFRRRSSPGRDQPKIESYVQQVPERGTASTSSMLFPAVNGTVKWNPVVVIDALPKDMWAEATKRLHQRNIERQRKKIQQNMDRFERHVEYVERNAEYSYNNWFWKGQQRQNNIRITSVSKWNPVVCVAIDASHKDMWADAIKRRQQKTIKLERKKIQQHVDRFERQVEYVERNAERCYNLYWKGQQRQNKINAIYELDDDPHVIMTNRKTIHC